jgi:hypothetical protein
MKDPVYLAFAAAGMGLEAFGLLVVLVEEQ